MTDDELMAIMVEFGEVQRVRILRDDAGKSKGIGFATFRKQEDATKVAEEGHVRYEFYELPVEKATMSKAKRDQMEANKNRGDRDGRFGDREDRRGDRGERREYREKQWGGDGDRRGGDGDRWGGYRRNDGDGGYRRNNDGGDTILRRNMNQ